MGWIIFILVILGAGLFLILIMAEPAFDAADGYADVEDDFEDW